MRKKMKEENGTDKIDERIVKTLCPLCGRRVGSDFKVIEDPKRGKVWVCKHHPIPEEAKDVQDNGRG